MFVSGVFASAVFLLMVLAALDNFCRMVAFISVSVLSGKTDWTSPKERKEEKESWMNNKQTDKGQRHITNSLWRRNTYE